MSEYKHKHKPRYELQCITCKNTFLGRTKNAKNCSDKCKNIFYARYNEHKKNNRKYKINCKQCSIEHKTNQKTTVFCSAQCGVQWTLENNKAAFNTGIREYKKTCIICKKEFTRKAKNAKSCSNECREKHRRNRHKKCREKKERIIKCIYCQKEHRTYKRYTRFCSRSCGSKWIIENTNKFDKWINSDTKYSVSRNERELLSLIKMTFNKHNITSHNKANIKVNNVLYKPDILINDKIVIEYYGDYWHMNPLCYNKDDYNKNKKKYASDIWKYDNDRKITLEHKGYNIIIVWENDYKTNKQEIVKALFEQIEDLLLCEGDTKSGKQIS